MGCGASKTAPSTQLGKPVKERLGGSGTKPSPTMWVGGIPASCAHPDALQEVFREYGHVVAVKVRPKPGVNKSWAFVTLDSTANATKAMRATVQIMDRKKNVLQTLKVSPGDVEGERERVKELALEEAKKKKGKSNANGEDDEDEWDEWGRKPKRGEEETNPRRRSLQSDSERRIGLSLQKSVERDRQRAIMGLEKSAAKQRLWAEEQIFSAAHRARNEEERQKESTEHDEKMAPILDAKGPWTCDVCRKPVPRFLSLSLSLSLCVRVCARAFARAWDTHCPLFLDTSSYLAAMGRCGSGQRNSAVCADAESALRASA